MIIMYNLFNISEVQPKKTRDKKSDFLEIKRFYCKVAMGSSV